MIRIVALILISNFAFAQKIQGRSSSYPIDEIKTISYSFPTNEFPNDEKQIAEYLSQKINHLSSPLSALKLLYIKESPGGKHFCYEQIINGIAVYRSQIKVNILKNKKAVNVFALTFSPEIISAENFPSLHLSEQFIQKHNDVSKSKSSKIYYLHQGKLIPAYLIYLEKKGCLSFEYIMDFNGDILYSNDLHSYSGKKDSLAVFNIFNPDPITSAQTVYGAPYSDNNNSDNSSLSNEIQQKELLVKFENDTFYLENDYYKIADVDEPNNSPAISKNDSFCFNRSQLGFEEANSFYHISNYRNHIKSLGFNNIVDFPLWIDAHAHSGGDNSSFNEFSSPVTLLFGDGGIDDAEDADVIVHEYGHSVSAAASPFSNSGLERKAVDEGFGDYVAASYSRSISTYDWENLFNWDGHNEFWSGRNAASSNHYPEDYKSNKWIDGEMWSSTLMQIQDDLGTNTCDSLIFQALYSQTANTSMRDAAQLLIDADTALFNGKHYTALYSRLEARGFLEELDTSGIITDKDIEVFNSFAFIKGEALTIAFKSLTDATIELYDISGRLIDKVNCTAITQTPYSANNISDGAYILKISTSVNTLSVSLLKY